MGRSVVKIENLIGSFVFFQIAIYDCKSLKSVYYNGDKASWYNITFSNETSNPLYYGAKLYTKDNR